MRSQHFKATIYKVGINPCVEVPKRVSTALAKKGNIPVVGRLNGFPIRATLVSLGNGRHRLYINGEMRKGANVDTGDRIHVAVQLDTQPRTVPVPGELARALEKNRRAKAAYERLPPSKRKEFLLYLNWLKRPETRKRIVEKIIAKLLDNGSER